MKDSREATGNGWRHVHSTADWQGAVVLLAAWVAVKWSLGLSRDKYFGDFWRVFVAKMLGMKE